MASRQDQYSEEEWKESAGHDPLGDLDVNVRLLLHRQFMWMNYQRRRFSDLLPSAPSPEDTEAWLASEAFCSLYLWYALLATLIEGFDDKGIELRGPMADDINAVKEPLRRTRNAVFHVAQKYWDKRLFGLMDDTDNVPRLYRISEGFGRLFLEGKPPS